MTLVLPLGMLSFHILTCVLVCVCVCVWFETLIMLSTLHFGDKDFTLVSANLEKHRKFMGDFQKARLIHGA